MSKAATLEINSAALKAASVATAIVFSKCVAVNLAQAVLKFQLGSRPPEDSDVAGLIGFGEQTKFGTSDSGSDALARVERIQANDNENVPFGLVLIWAGVLATKNPSLHAKLALGACGACVPALLCLLSGNCCFAVFWVQRGERKGS